VCSRHKMLTTPGWMPWQYPLAAAVTRGSLVLLGFTPTGFLLQGRSGPGKSKRTIADTGGIGSSRCAVRGLTDGLLVYALGVSDPTQCPYVILDL
jgi:hypothetical protein